MKRHTFTRYERLKSRKTTKELFDKGSSVFLYPFKIMFAPIPAAPDPKGGFFDLPKIMISVSKRNFKRANQRNRIRRRIREAYRLHKARLFENVLSETSLAIGIVYVAKETEPSKRISKKLVEVLQKMLQAYQTGATPPKT